MEAWSTYDWSTVLIFCLIALFILKSVVKAHGLRGTLQWLLVVATAGFLGILAIEGLMTLIMTFTGWP